MEEMATEAIRILQVHVAAPHLQVQKAKAAAQREAHQRQLVLRQDHEQLALLLNQKAHRVQKRRQRVLLDNNAVRQIYSDGPPRLIHSDEHRAQGTSLGIKYFPRL